VPNKSHGKLPNTTMIYYYAGVVITRQSQGMMLFQAGRRRPRRLSSSSLGRFIIQPVATTVVHVRNIVSTTSSSYSSKNKGDKITEKETTTKNSDSQQQQQQNQQQQQHQPQSQSESILSTTSSFSSSSSSATQPTKVQNGIDESSPPSSPPSLLVSNERDGINTDTNNGGSSSSSSSRAAMYYDKAFQFISERSGSSEILQLKESVNDAGLAFDQASAAVTLARRKLDETLRTWERSSGQHMQLLQRRESWTPNDAQQFADLVTTEITSRHELEFCRKNLAQSEESLTRSQLDYINKMRKRYHEENMWQDQWRVIGTYGTWILIGLNSCVFLGSQYNLRLRETERMETIKQLLVLHGNGNGYSNNKVATENDATETRPSLSIDAEEIVDTVVVVVTNEVEKDRSSGNTIENHADSSEKDEEIEESIRCDDDEAKEETVTTTETFQNRIQHRIRSDAKHLLSLFQHQIRAAIPRTKIKIVEEFPKSVSDINVPSAIIGASITGITMITISIIFSSFSARR
jgi:hypothetical protein